MRSKEVVAYTPTPKLGLGFPQSSLRAALDKRPDYIGVDCGGTDSGPYDLGSGENLTHAAQGIDRDLEVLLTAATENKIPLLIGTAGHAGGEPHLRTTREAIEKIIERRGLHLTVAYIHAEQDKAFLKAKLSGGKLKALNPWGFSKQYPMDDSTIESSNRIVGVMGIDPYIRALEAGAEVVVAGRSSDPAIIACIAIREGFSPGPAWHASQIICDGTTDAPDGQPDGMIARIRDDSFVVEPANPGMKFPVSTAVGLALHETGSPYLLAVPSGVIDTKECKYEQLSDREVRVTGSKFHTSKNTVKLEGTRREGFRSVFFGGVRDPQIIAQVDQWLDSYKVLLNNNLETIYGRRLTSDEFSIHFRVYGRNGVMGALEPVKQIEGHEIFVLTEVIAETENMSFDIGMRARQLLSHFDAPRGSKSGNPIAIPFSPQPLKAGWVYRWTFNHIVEIEDPRELEAMFPMDLVQY